MEPKSEESEAVGQFLREDFGFFGEVASARPVTVAACIAGGIGKFADLGKQIGLRGTEALTLRQRNIVLHRVEAALRVAFG